MIEIKNVTKAYLTSTGRHFVFRNLNFTFNGERNIALLGGNGAGKSTLIRMLGGVETPDAGSIMTGGKRLSWPVNFTGTAQATLSGRDTVKFVCRILGVDGVKRDETLAFVNEFAGLGQAFDKTVKTYSSGMRSRLVFAMTMAFDFDYYLIDEVSSGGDIAFKDKSRAILREKMKTANILLVSHNMKIVREFCDEVVLLSDGGLFSYDSLEEGICAYQGSGYRPPRTPNIRPGFSGSDGGNRESGMATGQRSRAGRRQGRRQRRIEREKGRVTVSAVELEGIMSDSISSEATAKSPSKGATEVTAQELRRQRRSRLAPEEGRWCEACRDSDGGRVPNSAANRGHVRDDVRREASGLESAAVAETSATCATDVEGAARRREDGVAQRPRERRTGDELECQRLVAVNDAVLAQERPDLKVKSDIDGSRPALANNQEHDGEAGADK